MHRLPKLHAKFLPHTKSWMMVVHRSHGTPSSSLAVTRPSQTLFFVQPLIHLHRSVATHLPHSTQLASFMCLRSAISTRFASTRLTSTVTTSMPETRLQTRNRARQNLPDRTNPQSWPHADHKLKPAPPALLIAAKLGETDPQEPHNANAIPSTSSVASDPQLRLSEAVAPYADRTHNSELLHKRKRYAVEKHATSKRNKRPHIPSHLKQNDIEDAPSLPSPNSARNVLNLLRSHYRHPLSTATHPKTKPRKELLDSLVATILSQATSNVNSSRAFRNLKNCFPTWESALEAGPKDIETSIACGGLAQAKSKVIHNILTKLKKERGSCCLEFIREMPSDQVKELLCSFKGVGPKTASCVLMFAMGRPEFPVDTHVRRLASRLGWMPPSSTPEKTYEELNACLPDDTKYDLHVLLIEHGRKTCKAGTPLCNECPLVDLCCFPEKK